MSDRRIEALADHYGAGPVRVHILQEAKRGGELMATYEMEYPSLLEMARATRSEFRDGRVDGIEIAGQRLAANEIARIAQALADEAG